MIGAERRLLRRPVEEIVAEAIWGDGRMEPGAPAWTMRHARLLSLPIRANVIIFGAGAGAPVTDIKNGTRWKVTGLTRATIMRNQNDLRSYETALKHVSGSGAAGALSFFELRRDPDPAGFARLAAEYLRPGAKTVFVDYVVARQGRAVARLFSVSSSRRAADEFRDTAYAE